MRFRRLAILAIASLFLVPLGSSATPPDHAPAHGVRDKHRHHHDQAGFEIVFDSELGVHIAVGLPGIFFHEGYFYRHTSDGWRKSLRADSGWGVAVAIPSNIKKAKGHPGPARWRAGRAGRAGKK